MFHSTCSLVVYLTGAPQVLRHSVDREVEVEKGSEAKLSVVFCSNPGPSKAIWEWGSLQLEAGYEMGRFSAEKMEKVAKQYTNISSASSSALC